MRNPYGHSEPRTEARASVRRRGQQGDLMRVTTGLALVVTVLAGLLSSCATAPASREEKAALVAAATTRRQQMSTADPAVSALLRRAYGYALFPHVDKGGLGVGGAYGRGVVYEQGQHVGYSDLTLGSVGVQAGGQSFSELLVFETKARARPLQGGPVQYGSGRLGRGPDEWRRDDGDLRRRGGSGGTTHEWGDGGSRHWGAAVHLSGQVRPSATARAAHCMRTTVTARSPYRYICMDHARVS